jgi:phosphatidyl-myo-inositol alpha-mannosyltransferase
MRIALVCPYAWDRPGGVQTHVRALARKLAGREHDVLVVAPSQRAVTATDEPFEFARTGRAFPVPANGSVAPISFGPRSLSRVATVLEGFAPEVLHLHEPLVPSVSFLALRTGAAPAVGTFHAATEKSAGYRAARSILEPMAQRLAVRTAVSPAARALVERYFPGDYVLTPNGVDVARFARAASNGTRSSGKKKVLFLSRIERRKGLQTLVQALAAQRDLDASLEVVGTGPQERACRELAERLLVNAEFRSRMTDDEVARAYAGADVFCAPGLGGESFGIVLLEAMAAGTPVVASDLAAFRAVAGDAAVYAEPGNPASLAGALRKVLTDGALADRLRKAGAETARRYDWDRLVGGVELAYDMALRAGTLRRAERPLGPR